MPKNNKTELIVSQSELKITLISLHGLIRVREPELGRDADTGGQVKYVLELARELARHPRVREVELLTRQILDPKVDSQYGVLEEPIAENAKLVRIPFGPRRYLKKESLWPYLEMFVDQTLAYFKRHGLPDVIHGHYADAGMAGAQLARLLHVPYIFTGHSLGRVKRQRLLLAQREAGSLEKKYRFGARIEAEEVALETATMVVTSTNQEVEQQYALYDHYVPERMEVIPPGVDLTAFHAPRSEDEPLPPIAEDLDRFLRCPEKPMILAMARPDERKNIGTLVRVFGQSEQLRAKANLVLVLGTRQDLNELPKSQQAVLQSILYQIDFYDLYGSVAYPKYHQPSDVPDLYRLAYQRRGVFVNPAHTEPFGLTLLEAAATGLPIVATNDGGPRDIVAHCENGLLVDPLDDEAIEQALLRMLTEDEAWKNWSAKGMVGAKRHYSWEHHVDRYLRDLADIVEHVPRPALTSNVRERAIPSFDRLIITDLDNTLTGDDESLTQLLDILKQHDNIGFGIATGRRLDSALELIEQLHLPIPELISTDVGTQLHYGRKMTEDRSWRKQIGHEWKPDAIRDCLDSQQGFYRQLDENQSEFKISYEIDPEKSPTVAKIQKILRAAGLRAKVVLSLGMYLDVIPVRGGSDLAMRHLLWKWGFPPEHVLVAGDSGNDAGMLQGRTLGVVVGNYSPELERLRKWPRIYFAQAAHAAGIIEGIHYYNFLDQPRIPNERDD